MFVRNDRTKNNLIFVFGITAVVGAGLSVPLVGFAYSYLLITIAGYVSPTVGITIHLGSLIVTQINEASGDLM